MNEESNAISNNEAFLEAIDNLFRESKARAISPFYNKLHARHKQRKEKTALPPPEVED